MSAAPSNLRRLALPLAAAVMGVAVAVVGVLRTDEVLLVFGVLLGLALVLTWPAPSARGRRAAAVRAVVGVLVLGLGLGLPLLTARATSTAGTQLILTDLGEDELNGRDGSPPVVRTSATTGYLDTSERIRLLDTAAGTERWSLELPGTTWTAPGGDLVTSDGGRILRTDAATGRPVWDETFTAEGDAPRPVAADEDVVVVQTCAALLDDDWPPCRYQGVGRDGAILWTEDGRELRAVTDGGVNAFSDDPATGLVGALPQVLVTLAVQAYSPDLVLRSVADGALQQQVERPDSVGPGEAGPADGAPVDQPETDEELPAVIGPTLLRSERDGERCTVTAYRGSETAWSSEVSCFSYGGGVLSAPQLERGFVQQQRLWYYLDELDRDAATLDLASGETRAVGPVAAWDTADDQRSGDLVPGPGLLLQVDDTQVAALAPATGDVRWQHSTDGARVRRAWVGDDVVALWTTPAPEQLFLSGARTDELSVYDAGTGALTERLPFDPREAGSALVLWDRLLVVGTDGPGSARLLG